jgi:two-component system chemotaxis response regulator CheB
MSSCSERIHAVRKTKVLVIDDSALMRGLLTKIVDRETDMQVVGCAPDPLRARELIRDLDPDVLTLDIEMPRMDGLDFLERLMRLRPMPVVMVSTLTERGSEATLRALELGAIDFVAKPKIDIASGIEGLAAQIVERIRTAARARVRAPTAAPARPPALGAVGDRRLSTEKIIAIGASTGGTEALREFLVQLPPDAPGIVITQHMPAGFTRTFAARLDGLCRISVKEAGHGERVLPGHAYIAPGDQHLAVRRSGANYITVLSDGPPVNRHRPSVEVLFRAVAEHVGPNAVGLMLTGMGKDGATAMLEMRHAGAYNLAQDEATCVVFGMPREAIAVGAVHEVAGIGSLPGRVLQHLRSKPHGTRV